MLDINLLAEALGFEEEEAIILLELFMESLETSLANIEDALASNDFKKIAYEAHAIKGSAANLLLADIVDIAVHIEKCAKSQDIVSLSPLIDKMGEVVDELNILELEND